MRVTTRRISTRSSPPGINGTRGSPSGDGWRGYLVLPTGQSGPHMSAGHGRRPAAQVPEPQPYPGHARSPKHPHLPARIAFSMVACTNGAGTLEGVTLAA